MTKRFPPLHADMLDADQRRMAERATPTGPFDALLHAPLLWEALQPLRLYLARESCLQADEREAAILVLARHRDAPAMAKAHHRLAQTAGLSAATIAALGLQHAPLPEGSDQLSHGTVLAVLITEQLATRHRIDDALFDRAIAQWGKRGVLELLGIFGFFSIIGLTLNVMEDDGEI